MTHQPGFRTLHFDCFSGAAGDMLVGALLDVGVPESVVRDALEGLGIQGWRLTISEVRRAGIRARRAEVTVAERGGRRSYRELVGVVEGARLPEGVRRRVLATFAALAGAEAKVHGVALDDVHLHEAGAIDALVDVVGACAAIEHLAPERVSASAIATGSGTVTTEHGELPVPAPAVVELLRGAPLVGRGTRELVTPTGAALLRAACDEIGVFPDMRVDDVGYGAGSNDDPRAPNVVRALVGRAVEAEGSVVVVETNLDDLSPEVVPHVLARTLEEGALDAWATPVLMKKGRPGYVLSVLCDEARRAAITDVLFRESSTLGVRYRRVDRTTLPREVVDVEVDGVAVTVKVARLGDEVVNVAPEHEDVRVAAARLGLPLKEVYARAAETARRRLRR